ncbi:hypothetical protein H4R20_005639 [Coemansia guatemalensis]|uniref:Elongation factor P n=1 Tax=Coemansia guatemalensis TaxID=2761395 RepID=A0A9W8HPZ4_9FUNG|nr:hypothetical protein H4R20_005639 [Coemansia guatemalensis]
MICRALGRLAHPRIGVQLPPRRWIQIGPNTVRLGMVIDHKGEPQIVESKDHGGTGRGQAVVKLNLRHAATGVRSQVRFRGSDTLELMKLVQNKYQFLYTEGNKAHMLNMQSFEELAMDMDTFEGAKDKIAFLEDGMEIIVQSLEPEPGPISWRLPSRYTFKVKSVEARLAKDKGATYSPATLENNARVSVPDFIKPGDSIVVDLDKTAYVGRG